jgi:hypothetical protein
VPPTLWPGGGRAHSLAGKGLGETQFRRGTYTVVLFISKYFVGDRVKLKRVSRRGFRHVLGILERVGTGGRRASKRGGGGV